MAKKIQSNVWCMSKSFGSAESALYGRRAPKLRPHLHLRSVVQVIGHGPTQSRASRQPSNAARIVGMLLYWPRLSGSARTAAARSRAAPGTARTRDNG